MVLDVKFHSKRPWAIIDAVVAPLCSHSTIYSIVLIGCIS